MNLSRRTLIFGGLGLLTIVCCFALSSASTNERTGVVVWLPPNYEGFRGQEAKMGEKEKEWLPKDTTFHKMVYHENSLPLDAVAGYKDLHATLIVAGSDSRSLHRPRVCLTAQGWTIVKRESAMVELETKGGPLQVMNYSIQRVLRNSDGSVLLDEDGEKVLMKAHYVYWWVGPDSTTADDKEKVWRSVWGSIFQGANQRWAYPSIMVYVDPRKGEEGDRDARDRAYTFIKEYAPSFQRSLGAQDRDDALGTR